MSELPSWQQFISQHQRLILGLGTVVSIVVSYLIVQAFNSQPVVSVPPANPPLNTQVLSASEDIPQSEPEPTPAPKDTSNNQVTVNGQTIPLPRNTTVHKTIPLPGGQVTVDASSNSNSGTSQNSSTSIDVSGTGDGTGSVSINFQSESTVTGGGSTTDQP